MPDLRVSFPKPCDEAWEMMKPAGCARICAQCDKAVHDLSRYDIDEVEALARDGEPICVRATIDAGGEVALRGGGVRRMMLAAALTAGMAAASQPALAGPQRPSGSISGSERSAVGGMRVVATDGQGRRFSARVHSGGNYRIRNLPAGTYTLRFQPACGEAWTIENVVVGDVQTVVPDSGSMGGCIIIGLLRIEPDAHG
jgi:Carboxypeptidase regulatory-like domain